MVRPDGLIICDLCKRKAKEGKKIVFHGDVLDDGITIMPGYIEVVNGNAFVITSSDPNYKTQQLFNRKNDDNGVSFIIKTLLDSNLDPKLSLHFCNKFHYEEYKKRCL